MNYFSTHPKIRWTALIVAAVLVIGAVFLATFDWNRLRPALARIISAKTGRPASIQGDLKVHLWSWTPSAQIGGLTVRNPAWAERPVMFEAKELTVSVSLGRLLRGQLVLPQIAVVQPSVDLERDADGRASWEFGEPGGKPRNSTAPTKIPAIRSLTIEEGDVHVSDKVRKLVLSGSLAAADRAGAQGASAFNLRLSGTLNEKPFQVRLNGGPLINLDPDRPYELEAHLRASDITLDARVSFPKPFDLAAYGARFQISGNDLADVYYLTGLALPNTPSYRLAADLQHRGTLFRMDDLKGRLGSSDLEGTMQIETKSQRPKLTAKLKSNKLDLADLAPTLGHPNGGDTLSAPGPAAAQNAAQTPPAAASGDSASAPSGDGNPAAAGTAASRLLPDANLQLNRVRGMDADVTYQADSVAANRLPMQKVSFHLTLDDGLLKIDPLSFALDQGTFAGSVVIDARKNDPATSIDMAIDDVDLAQFKSAAAKEPPLQGSLDGRLRIHGFGTSVHKLASTADGGISMAIPSGRIDDVIAELTGINVLRGLGLLLSQDDKQTDIRCGVVDFQAVNGVLDSKTVFIDTSNVLITGRGNINLGSERLDLALQGDPKKVRLLRLRSPITLHGTLLHPTVGIKADKLLEQVGVAAALGALLTPVASALAFIDPGLAKNKNCTAVLAQAEEDLPQSGPVPHAAPAAHDQTVRN